MTDPRIITKIGYLLLDNARQFHAAHLTTYNLTYHKEMKEVYEGLDSDGDALIETIEGAFGTMPPEPFSNVRIPENPAVAIAVLQMLLKTVNSVECSDRGVNAELDNIAGHLNSFIFLLAQCTDTPQNAPKVEQKVPDGLEQDTSAEPETEPEPEPRRKSMFPMRR